jgi:hypothetical protein
MLNDTSLLYGIAESASYQDSHWWSATQRLVSGLIWSEQEKKSHFRFDYVSYNAELPLPTPRVGHVGVSSGSSRTRFGGLGPLGKSFSSTAGKSPGSITNDRIS